MAIRSPLVIGSDGLVQQLQSGDSISAAVSTPSVRSVTNGESATVITLGTPVYATANDAVKRAQANAKTTAALAGLVFDATIAAGAAGNIAQSGVLVATTTQWDAVVTSETGGLSFGSLYFLDPANVGKITTVVPTTVGQVLTRVGRALSSTELELDIAPPLQL